MFYAAMQLMSTSHMARPLHHHQKNKNRLMMHNERAALPNTAGLFYFLCTGAVGHLTSAHHGQPTRKTPSYFRTPGHLGLKNHQPTRTDANQAVGNIKKHKM